MRLLLLDANVVIEAYVLGIWDKLVERTEVSIPSIVVKDEALFYSSEEGQIPSAINLVRLIGEGKIKQVEATVEEMDELQSKFDAVFVEHIHPGEREALALLLAGKLPEHYFCSGDAKAIQAAAMLRLAEQIISMERVLQEIGMQKNLKFWFREDFCKKHLDIGHKNLIQGIGLSKR